MALLTYPVALLPMPLAAVNFGLPGDTSGTIANNNRVVKRIDASGTEVPVAGARVRLHRLIDGYCAWQGTSDADGYYWPTGLEVGLEYYPVAIDLTRQFECDAAGPVLATTSSPRGPAQSRLPPLGEGWDGGQGASEDAALDEGPQP